MAGKTAPEKQAGEAARAVGKKERPAGGKQPQGRAGYTKEQLLRSGRYRGRRDLLMAILSDKESYEIETVDTLIGTFLKGKVN